MVSYFKLNEGTIKNLDNPETLATLGTQDEGNQNTQKHNTTQKTKKMSSMDIIGFASGRF
jgi:hypothetical protein